MTLQDINNLPDFTIACEGDTSLNVTDVFCCDMLSLAMSKGIEGAAWVTVMGRAFSGFHAPSAGQLPMSRICSPCSIHGPMVLMVSVSISCHSIIQR